MASVRSLTRLVRRACVPAGAAATAPRTAAAAAAAAAVGASPWAGAAPSFAGPLHGGGHHHMLPHRRQQTRGFFDGQGFNLKQRMTDYQDKKGRQAEVDRFDKFMAMMLSWEGECTLARYAAKIKQDAEDEGMLGLKGKVTGKFNKEQKRTIEQMKRSLRIYAALVEQWPQADKTPARLVPVTSEFNERVAAAASGGGDGDDDKDAANAKPVTADEVKNCVAEFSLSQFMVSWLREREEQGLGLPSTQPELSLMLGEAGAKGMGRKVMKRVRPLFQSRGGGARMEAEQKRRMRNVPARPASGRKSRRW